MATINESWAENNEFLNEKRLKTFKKRHPRETASCFMTVQDILGRLKQGHLLGSFMRSAVRSEGSDLWRIAPRGINAGRAEIRLYFYVCQVGKTLYLLTLGDKTTQQSDITQCKHLIATRLSASREKP